MSLDKMIPAPPSVTKWHLLGWLSVISVVITLVAFYDFYFGKGDLFGMAKKKTTTTKELEA